MEITVVIRDIPLSIDCDWLCYMAGLRFLTGALGFFSSQRIMNGSGCRAVRVSSCGF